MKNSVQDEIPIEELFKKTFEESPDVAVEIFIENYLKDRQTLHAIELVRENKEFNLKVLEKIDSTIIFPFFFQMPAFLKNDKDIALQSMNRMPSTFQYISERLKGDRDIILLMAKKVPNLSREATGEIGEAIRYIPSHELVQYVESLIIKQDLDKDLPVSKIEAKKIKI